MAALEVGATDGAPAGNCRISGDKRVEQEDDGRDNKENDGDLGLSAV